MKAPLCIYHHNCADGFTAAWVVHQALTECEFHPAIHGNPPPEVKGRDVIIVDFCYKPDVLEAMIKDANSILVIDHHKSAVEEVRAYPYPSWLTIDMSNWTGSVNWSRYTMNLYQDEFECSTPHIYFYFDMERSGAGMAWDFFFPEKQRPALINHVEDRDLWRFKLPHTRTIQAAVFSFEYTFEKWSELMAVDTAWLAEQGRAIERKHFKDVNELISSAKRRLTIGGHDVPVLNAPYFYRSDAGHIMAQGEPFAACYWDTPDGRVFSLRSTDEGEDVSAIAKQYGGGGHRNASGFRMAVGWEGDNQ